MYMYSPLAYTHLESQVPVEEVDPFMISLSQTLKKILHAPAGDRTGDPSIYSLALYNAAIKAGLYRKAVQVYYILNQYPVTFPPTILNSASNSQEYKNHLR